MAAHHLRWRAQTDGPKQVRRRRSTARHAVRRRLRALRLARGLNRPINGKALRIVLQWERSLERFAPAQRAIIFDEMRAVLVHIQQLHRVLEAAGMEPATSAQVISQVVKQPVDTWLDTVAAIARDSGPG